MKDACSTMSFAKPCSGPPAEAGPIIYAKVKCGWDRTGRMRAFLSNGCCARVAHWMLACSQSTAQKRIQIDKASVVLPDRSGQYMHVDGRTRLGTDHRMRDVFSCTAISLPYGRNVRGEGRYCGKA